MKYFKIWPLYCLDIFQDKGKGTDMKNNKK